PATGDAVSGWVDGNFVQARYAKYFRGQSHGSASFTIAVQPDGALDNTNGDCLRTQNTYRGTFVQGSWTFNVGVRANASGGLDAATLRIRVFRSANPNGSSAAELTGSTQVSGGFSDTTTGAQTVTIAWLPGSITLSDEYLFVELAYGQGPANGDGATWLLQKGAAYTVVTPNFTAASTGP